MATYPSQISSFPTHVNLIEIIDASHPNNIQTELVAVETTLGTNPATSTTPNPAGTFTSSSTAYTSIKDRLANIETGIVSDSHSQYIRKGADGSNIVTPNTNATKGLIIKGAASQSANLQEWQDSTGTVLFSVGATGDLTGVLDGGTP